MSLFKKIHTELSMVADANKAKFLKGFFKTGKGQYGEGDAFLGITVPVQRQIAKKFQDAEFIDLEKLLSSKWHEERLTALLILLGKYHKGDASSRRHVYDFYFTNIQAVNNWDLVDLSAPGIVGRHLLDKDKKILRQLFCAENLWQRRIAIVATYYFIRHNLFTETLFLAKKLLDDKEDLMHKATGWMLREVGKRDFSVLDSFLREHYKNMPRTMLRYAIEKYPEKLRLAYLHGKV